jgi:hypothetical protein
VPEIKGVSDEWRKSQKIYLIGIKMVIKFSPTGVTKKRGVKNEAKLL